MRVTTCISLLAVAATVACGQADSGGNRKDVGGHPEQFGDDTGSGDKGILADGDVSGPTGGSGGTTQTGMTGGTGGGVPAGGSSGTGGSSPINSIPAACEDAVWSAEGTIRTGVADANGMVAASRAHEWLMTFGLAPLPAAMRLDDFFNYYQGVSANSVKASDMTIDTVLRARPIPNQFDLYVGIHAPTQTRPRSVLQIVVDTTPSMSGVPLQRARSVLEALGEALVANDSVTISTTDPGQGSMHFDITDPVAQMTEAQKLVQTSTSADVTKSLADAYARAQGGFDASANNRVFFLSDGAEPIDALPTSEIGQGASKGIFLVGVGLGPTTSYRERLLDEATIVGRGSYVFIENEETAKELVRDRYDQLVGIAYDSVQVNLDLPWYFHRVQEALTPGGGNVSSQPQYLAPGASMTLLFRLEICDKTMLAQDLPMTVTVDFQDPKTKQDDSRNVVVSAIFKDTLAAAPALDKALAIKDYVSALQSLDAKRLQRAATSITKLPASDPDVVKLSEQLEALQKIVPHG